MIQISQRTIEAGEDEVVRGNVAYKRKVGSLQTTAQIKPEEYALVQEGDRANKAISMKQQLVGLNFAQMNAEALKVGLPLARVADFTLYHRNVNLALQEKGVLYDASGNLIGGKRLIECGKAVNNAWAYLNNAYEKGGGFLGLDVMHIVGFDGEKPVYEREPLEECVVDCWAEIEPINSQGYYTKKASVQKFELGRTVYAHKPVAGRVAGFGAYSDWAYLVGDRLPQGANSWLGGFLCAGGTAPKTGGK